MSELLTMQGKIKSFVTDNCIALLEGGLFSLYGGIPTEFNTYDTVRFAYKKKEKDGRVYNNIVEGSMELVAPAPQLPKDITQDYSQEYPAIPKMTDKDTLIVRQSCLKAAVELQQITSKEAVVELAEYFEKWVFR